MYPLDSKYIKAEELNAELDQIVQIKPEYAEKGLSVSVTLKIYLFMLCN